jgi:hypothetical protein
MNCRTRFSVACMVMCLVVVAWADTPVITVFELDGNSVEAAGAPPDWNTLNGTTGQNGSLSGANLKSFIVDGPGQTIFATASKDNADVTTWEYKSGSVPDKDELVNAYAASFTAGNGDTIVTFGADRLATNGDANIGIWFFQEEVGIDGTDGFTGQHTNGDVFVVSAFTNGGGISNIKVYEWDDTCDAAANNNPQVGQCADANLRVLFSSAQTCTGAGQSGHEACAVTNAANINVSWPYTAKFPPPAPNDMPIGGFFEGAINLTELFAGVGGTLPCFASFLVETRSSTSIDAVLKDFVGGSFPQCSIAVSKNCQCTAFRADGSGFDYSFSGTVTNSGGGTVYNVQVTDQGKTYSCGSLNAGASKNFPSADCTGPANTFFAATFPTTNQASATANTASDGTSGATLTATTGPVSCSGENPTGACTPNPQLTVNKTCVTTLQQLSGLVVVRVDYTGKVTNNGNVNINNISVTEDDNADGSVNQTFNVGTLAPGADECYTNGTTSCPTLTPPPAGQATVTGAASYFPNTFTAVTPLGRAKFSDTVRATGTSAFGQTVESHPAGSGFTAECLICPFGFCPTQ